MTIEEVVSAFAQKRPTYDAFCHETKRILEASFRSSGISVHTIEARAKSIESFQQKAGKLNSNSEPKYNDPLRQITDLAAVRIITYTLADVQAVSSFISKYFEVVEKTDVGEKRFADGKFGYQSIHFLVKFLDNRANLPDAQVFAGLVCEMQIRTILQHAWAELEHDIQYKNQSGLPADIQRKFMSLAGLLEIADREFQSIQDTDAALKKVVSQSLQEDLTRTAIAEPVEGKVDSSSSSPVRQLIRQSRYEDAVKLYDEKISTSPIMHTLFIGRAKALFLSGDRARALEDIARAELLNPDDPAIAVLRRQVEEGFSPTIPSETVSGENTEVINKANDLTKKGNISLEAGDGAAAFEYYFEAQELGASRPFSTVNKAMACLVASDFDGAKIQLSSLQLRTGTPFAVVILAIYCLVYAFGSEERFDEELLKLQEAVQACDNFSLPISPLPRLLKGLDSSKSQADDATSKRISEVLAVLTASNIG